MFTSHFYIFFWILLIHIIKALQFLVFKLFLLRAGTIHDNHSESWPWLLSWRQQSISRAGLTSSSKAPPSGGIIIVSFCQKSPFLWLFQKNGRYRRVCDSQEFPSKSSHFSFQVQPFAYMGPDSDIEDLFRCCPIILFKLCHPYSCILSLTFSWEDYVAEEDETLLQSCHFWISQLARVANWLLSGFIFLVKLSNIVNKN